MHEFLEGLRRGRSVAHGGSGGGLRLGGDVARLFVSGYAEAARLAAANPAALLSLGLALASVPLLREVLAGLLAVVQASAAFGWLKRRIRRRRPCDVIGNLYYDVRPGDRFSFPSGHSATSFAIAVVLALAFSPLGPLFLGIAGVVAASRVMLGVHYVSDVVAGALLGAAIGWLSHALLC